MKDNLVDLKISPELIETVLEKKIQAGIVSALGDSEALIGKIVSQGLSRKVDREGNVSNSSYANSYDFLEIITAKSIHVAAKSALEEWLTVNAVKVKATVLKELKKPSRQRSLAVAYADAIEHSLKCSWRMNCDIKFEREDD